MNDLNQLLAYIHNHRQALLVGVMAAVLIAIAGTLIWSARRGRTDRWVANVVGLVVLALSAEGMWVIARERLHLTALFAGTVFFVGEAYMLAAMMRGNRHHAKHGHPGKHAKTVWMAAAVMGGIVSLNSASIVEFPLRVALPLAAAKLWHDTVTDDDAVREQSSWRWTPRRLFIALGAIEAGDRDVMEINRARQVSRMTRLACRLHTPGIKQSEYRRVYGRLQRLVEVADDGMVGEVHRRVTRVHNAATLTRPLVANEPATRHATHPSTAVATDPPHATQRVATTVARRPATSIGRRAAKQADDKSAIIAAVRADKPAITQKEASELTGISERVLSRHWKTTAPQAPINGHELVNAQ